MHNVAFTHTFDSGDSSTPWSLSLQVLVMLGRMQRGAQLLAAEGLVPACKELLVGMMVRLRVIGGERGDG